MRYQSMVILVGGFLALANPLLSKMYQVPMSFTMETINRLLVDQRLIAGGVNAILSAEAERFENEQFAAPFQFANSVEVDLGLWNSGTWETLADGSRLWRLRQLLP